MPFFLVVSCQSFQPRNAIAFVKRLNAAAHKDTVGACQGHHIRNRCNCRKDKQVVHIPADEFFHEPVCQPGSTVIPVRIARLWVNNHIRARQHYFVIPADRLMMVDHDNGKPFFFCFLYRIQSGNPVIYRDHKPRGLNLVYDLLRQTVAF